MQAYLNDVLFGCCGHVCVEEACVQAGKDPGLALEDLLLVATCQVIPNVAQGL